MCVSVRTQRGAAIIIALHIAFYIRARVFVSLQTNLQMCDGVRRVQQNLPPLLMYVIFVVENVWRKLLLK